MIMLKASHKLYKYSSYSQHLPLTRIIRPNTKNQRASDSRLEKHWWPGAVISVS